MLGVVVTCASPLLTEPGRAVDLAPLQIENLLFFFFFCWGIVIGFLFHRLKSGREELGIRTSEKLERGASSLS